MLLTNPDIEDEKDYELIKEQQTKYFFAMPLLMLDEPDYDLHNKNSFASCLNSVLTSSKIDYVDASNMYIKNEEVKFIMKNISIYVNGNLIDPIQEIMKK